MPAVGYVTVVECPIVGSGDTVTILVGKQPTQSIAAAKIDKIESLFIRK